MTSTPSPRPRIFVSTVSSEFKSVRRRVDEVLRFLGYEPESMDIWGTESGDLRQLLGDKIDACEALVQIVGEAYGAEPPHPDPVFGQVSYTQYEFLYAEARGKKTHLIFAGKGCQRDRPIEQLDLPHDPEHPDPEAWQAERQALQAAYRARLMRGEHLRHTAANDLELENAILKLRNDSDELRKEFREWQVSLLEGQREILAGQKQAAGHSRKALGITLAALGGLAVVGVGAAVLLRQQNKADLGKVQAGQEQITAYQTDLDTQAATARARAMRDYHTRRDQLEKVPNVGDALQALEGEHQARLASIDRLFETLRVGYATGEIDEITRRFQGILNDKGIDAALAFLESNQAQQLQRVEEHLARRKEEEQQARTALRSFLVAAQAAAVDGRNDKAAALYEKVLKFDPDWNEALVAAVWFYNGRSEFEGEHGSLTEAFKAAETALAYGERLGRADPNDRALWCARLFMADLLVKRRGAGDTEAALGYYQRGLEVADAGLKEAPQSIKAIRDVGISLDRLADCLMTRSAPGDAALILGYYQRALAMTEEWLRLQPGSTEATRNVSVSLNRLGDFLSARGGAGDAETAMKDYQRSLELKEALLAADPKSAFAIRDVSLSASKVGDALLAAGDSDGALKQYERGLELDEKVLTENPKSAQAARDVSVILDKLGHFLVARNREGDLAKASGYQRLSLEISERLLKENPQSGEAERDISISLNRLGDIVAKGGPDGVGEARKYYERSVGISESLVGRDPHSGVARRDLSIGLNRLGDLLAKSPSKEDHQAARKNFERSVAIADELLGANPESVPAAKDAFLSHLKLASLLQNSGEKDASEKEYHACLDILEALVKAGKPLDAGTKNAYDWLKTRPK